MVHQESYSLESSKKISPRNMLMSLTQRRDGKTSQENNGMFLRLTWLIIHQVYRSSYLFEALWNFPILQPPSSEFLFVLRD